jgi:transposase InsO family protein
MKLHANARLSVKGRELLVDRVLVAGWSLSSAAEAAGVSERTVGKWVRRFSEEGPGGLVDRSSVPDHQPTRTGPDRVAAIAALRRVRLTAAQIAMALQMPLSTVSGILTAIGLGKLSRLEPLEAPNRYERRTPGELVHIDVKKLARIVDGAGHRITGNRATRVRGAGWEFVHVCVDDATRLAYVEVLANEKATTAVGFLRRALAFYRSHGVKVTSVMTDNGPAYISFAHKLACQALGLKHLRTRPYRPRTNGKAERFIRTMLGAWAYGAIYSTSQQRTAALTGWLEEYNWRRPHGSLSHKPPGARLREPNNLLRYYT